MMYIDTQTHQGHPGGQSFHSVNENYKKCSPVNVCRNIFNSDNFCEIDRDCLLNLNKTFNVLTLNCCGIRTKLNYSEFHELVNDLDVLCLVETKTDDLDEIIIPGFITKFKNRKAFANRKSGGIMLAFKQKL